MSSEVRVVSTLGGHDPTRPRKSCHRCGNVRKVMNSCSGGCVFLYCASCKRKLTEEFGEAAFRDGCPRCKGICCCFNKSLECPHQNHCYKKCPTTFGKREMPKNMGVPRPPSLPPPFVANVGSPTYQLATIASMKADESESAALSPLYPISQQAQHHSGGFISTPAIDVALIPTDSTSAALKNDTMSIDTGADQLMHFALCQGMTPTSSASRSDSPGSGTGHDSSSSSGAKGRGGDSSTSFSTPVTDTGSSSSTQRFRLGGHRGRDTGRGPGFGDSGFHFPITFSQFSATNTMSTSTDASLGVSSIASISSPPPLLWGVGTGSSDDGLIDASEYLSKRRRLGRPGYTNSAEQDENENEKQVQMQHDETSVTAQSEALRGSAFHTSALSHPVVRSNVPAQHQHDHVATVDSLTPVDIGALFTWSVEDEEGGPEGEPVSCTVASTPVPASEASESRSPVTH